MYEILHKEAPRDELEFYLFYAKKETSILEPLCGSGRFLVPFLERGYDIIGIDMSREMLAKLTEKAPSAKVVQADILAYDPGRKFDYIFISSGSVSLFTDMAVCKKVLQSMKNLLNSGGKFVFAVDTVFNRCPDKTDYQTAISVKTKEGFDLILKSKDCYDEETKTQFSPGIYELYDGEKLLQQEHMDFQTHLYAFGELEPLLRDIGFTKITAYSSFDKEIARDDQAEMFLYECSF